MPKPQSEIQHFTKNWQQQLADAFDNIEDLCRYLDLSPDDLPISVAATENFPLRVPLSFAACIEKGNPRDRRNLPYSELQLSKQKEQAAILSIQEDTSITEVILSGGDPLLLSDARLTRLMGQLAEIKHLKRIRIHTRLPIVLPARITDEFIDTLKLSPKQIILILHCNHANELNERVIVACNTLKNSGITLFNQSVLLKGVNDDADILCDLSEQLFSHGVIPYYLHLLDKATGTGHFEVSKERALELIQQVQATLPGYLVPKLVTEQTGAASKQYIF